MSIILCFVKKKKVRLIKYRNYKVSLKNHVWNWKIKEIRIIKRMNFKQHWICITMLLIILIKHSMTIWKWSCMEIFLKFIINSTIKNMLINLFIISMKLLSYAKKLTITKKYLNSKNLRTEKLSHCKCRRKQFKNHFSAFNN